jgi:hypothetical protein
LKILTAELEKRDLEINQGKFEAFESLFVERKRELSLFLISLTSVVSFLLREKKRNENSKLFRWFFLKHQKELLQLLNDYPREFKKRLKEIDLMVIDELNLQDNQKLELAKKTKFPMKGKFYSLIDYKEVRSAYRLLIENGLYGRVIRNREGVIDLDVIKKTDPLYETLYETQQQVFKNIVSYFIRNKLARKVVRSQSGGYHIFLKS